MIETLKNKYLIQGGTLTLSGSSSHITGSLPIGVYQFISDGAFNIRQGGSTVTAATSDWLVDAGEELVIVVSNGTTDSYVAGITPSGATASLYYKVKEIT